MNLFKLKKNKIADIEPADVEPADIEFVPVAYNGDNPLVVSVPEIKDYLVTEFEKIKRLQDIIYDLEEKLEIANEVKIKYDAAMVTIDEYSKRLADADDRIFKAREKTEEEKQKHAKTRDALNSLKLRLNEVALTKSQIKNEIVKEIKGEIISAIKAHKGALSKTSTCEIVNNARLPKKADHPTEKGGVE